MGERAREGGRELKEEGKEGEGGGRGSLLCFLNPSCCSSFLSPHIVSALWLLTCCSSGDKAEEEEFVCLQLHPPPVQEEGGKAGTKRGGRGKRRLEAEGEGEGGGPGSKKARVDEGEEAETAMEEEELLLQYQNGEWGKC